MAVRPAAGGGVDLGPLPGLIGYALRRAQIAVFTDFHATFAPAGLRPAEFSVLLVIQHNPGLRQGQVADALGIQPPNFGALLGRLTARGLVDRRASTGDRRAVALHLTTAGAALMAQAMALLGQHEQRWIDRLGSERMRALLGLLQDLAAP